MIAENPNAVSDEIHVAFCENIRVTTITHISRVFFTSYGHIDIQRKQSERRRVPLLPINRLRMAKALV